jgi:hypothetical protein
MHDFGPLTVAGLALVVGYWVWLWAFFARVRPKIMARLGRRLQVRVGESTGVLDGGTYEIQDAQAPLRKHGIVVLADFLLLVAGTVGVAALVFVPAFLVAESGVLLPLEGALTGRRAALGAPAAVAMQGLHADVPIVVRNTGHLALSQCALATSGYSARSGYVHGRSASFDVGPGEARKLVLALSAAKPVSGTHPIRVALECDARRIAASSVAVEVR